MRNATLCYLIKEKDNQIIEICLAMKKRGFGAGRWNGVGGKVDEKKETIEEAMIRETKEEIGVEIKDFEKVAELTFYFPHKPAWDQLVHVYLVKNWKGEPTESEEMKPQWFAPTNIPYNQCWPDDIYWMPKVLNKKKIKAKFVFDKEGMGNTILDHKIEIIT